MSRCGWWVPKLELGNQGRLGTRCMGQVRTLRRVGSGFVCYRVAMPATPAGATGPIRKGAVLSNRARGVAAGRPIADNRDWLCGSRPPSRAAIPAANFAAGRHESREGRAKGGDGLGLARSVCIHP